MLHYLFFFSAAKNFSRIRSKTCGSYAIIRRLRISDASDNESASDNKERGQNLNGRNVDDFLFRQEYRTSPGGRSGIARNRRCHRIVLRRICRSGKSDFHGFFRDQRAADHSGSCNVGSPRGRIEMRKNQIHILHNAGIRIASRHL